MFSINSLKRKAQLIQLGQFKPSNLVMPIYGDIELFKVFKTFDRNSNGFLELDEYTDCLTEFKELNLTREEVVTLSLQADINGDGRIDYEEFMKHFKELVYLLKVHKGLQDMYDEERALERFEQQEFAADNNNNATSTTQQN